MAGSKRTSTASASAAAKRAKKDDTMKKCQEIACSLTIAQKSGMPASVTTLLASVLPHCLPVFKDERHEFQNSLLEMIQKTLDSAQQALSAEVASAEEVVNGGDDERQRRETAVATSLQALLDSQEAHKAKQAAKPEKLEALKLASDSLKDSQAKQKSGDHDALVLESGKQALERAIADLLTPLKEGTGGKRQLQALAKQLHASSLEDSLIEAVELPLNKKPDTRGNFDKVVLEQVDTQIAEKLAALTSKLAAEAPAREARAAEVKAAQDNYDACKAASDTAAEELKCAKEAEAAAKTALAAAKESSKNHTQELLDAASHLDSARKNLENFRSGVLVAFEELLGRTAPVPEAETEALQENKLEENKAAETDTVELEAAAVQPGVPPA
eukprot:TRINITY_DN82283_c0_g1_i1.p1 TRINITY_DN82283_c0_g1~~TRINITY_DN82283_c0_g1_i1.p1  ORF type:complete len:387 (+),score=152.30 TRINITY_DN82283_c0_g1_i1:127-1287(+)